MALGDRVIQTSHAMSEPEIFVDVKNSTERFLDIARSVEHISLDDNSSTATQLPGVPGNVMTRRSLSNPGRFPIDTDTSSTPVAALQWDDSKSLPAHSTSAKSKAVVNTVQYSLNPAVFQSFPPTTGKFSPRLDYGLFGSPPRQLLNALPAVPWSQYLIAGPNSFAMRLYVDTLDTVLKALQGQITISGFVPHVCRYHFRYERPDTLTDLIRRQLNLTKTGGYKTNMIFEKRERDRSLVLLGPSDYAARSLIPQIIKDASQELGNLDLWLDPWGAQQYILSNWNIRLSSTTAKIPAHVLDTLNSSMQPRWEVVEDFPDFDITNNDVYPPTESGPIGAGSTSFSALPNFTRDTQAYEPYIYRNDVSNREPFESANYAVNRSALDQVHGIQSLVQQLSIDAVCFGDGPRFLKTEIDRVIQQFLRECRSC